MATAPSADEIFNAVWQPDRLKGPWMTADNPTWAPQTILINGYANSYSSYVTTHEEYELQCYEGASTLFGRWTLAAYCTQLYALARELDVRPVLSESPVRLPRAELPPSVYALA